MLKRNLFTIVITSLVLVFTGNAFGQWHPDFDKVKSPRDVATGQIQSPRDVASGQSTSIKAKNKSLINAGTGEVAWADEVRANRKT